MNQARGQINGAAEREILATRLVNAPRELVFKVWTEAEHIAKWWGPNGFTNTISEMNVQPGGVWKFMMHGPDGVNYPNKIIYQEVIAPERLVFLYGDCGDENANQFHVTVTFEAVGHQTNIVMHMVFDTPEERNKIVNEYDAIEGNKQTMDRMEKYLSDTPCWMILRNNKASKENMQ